ncbi:MAG: glycogen synthase GlgA [Rhizobiaceae bacterium]|nr:glycogen synthase GlgA [Rhizobiaceae bacterium]
MKVLSIASEVFPLVKTGGLADVVGALPLAMAPLGIEMGTFLPGYPAVLDKLRKRKVVYAYPDLQGGPASIVAGSASGLNLLVLEAPHLFNRPGGPYGDATGADWPDNWRRFAAFCQAGSNIAGGAVPGYRPDLVHAHDWQAAMTLAYMRYGGVERTPKVMTVHNLAFQGQFGASIFGELGLPAEAMSVDGVEYYGGVGFLKAGLQAAWAITTVSPTYAQEIRTAEFGMGLDGLINMRAADLVGIVNGIDTEIWDPATDELLAAKFSAKSLKGRLANKRAVEERFGLDRDEGPLFTVVSRLTWQKGMDILVSLLDPLVATGARLAVLGSGDRALEGALLAAAARHRGRIGVVIGYDEGLSHLIQGGADAILVPSRFEPCGLTQLYGLRYGCVPVVARTGGLADTVIDANEAAVSAGVATGFQFAPSNGDAFAHAIRRAVAAYAAKPVWTALQKQGMKADVSWQKSAARYADLYRTLIAAGHSA